jgi:putative ABC transport system ATP-binding protein
VYLVRSGQVEILRETDDGSKKRLRIVGPGGYFGELGPMLNLRRSASTRAVERTVLTGCSVRQFRSMQANPAGMTIGTAPG